jgi:hypothetical protein
MKGIRFYEEFTNKRKGLSAGNAVAVGESNRNGTFEAIVPLYDQPNSPVASGSISNEYLFEKCKRVSEARAREVHPNLFEYLDVSDN